MTPGFQRAARASEARSVPATAIASDKIRDLRVVVRNNTIESDFGELGKIGGAFATSYRVPKYRFAYKFPNRLRVDASLGPVGATVIYVDNDKAFRTPLGTQRRDTTGEPGQKQSLMDIGIFAADWLRLDHKATWLREEKGLQVYRLDQRLSDNKAHEIVWVNSKTCITEKRRSFGGDGQLVKEIRYLAPKEVARGVWLPTRVEIFNQFGKRGAVQEVEEIVLNQGVPDDVFKL